MYSIGACSTKLLFGGIETGVTIIAEYKMQKKDCKWEFMSS